MKKFNFDLASFLAGICVTTWVVIAVFFTAGGSINIDGKAVKSDTASAATDTDTDSTKDPAEEKKWNTKELKKTITVDNKKLTFHAPSDYYSITDQYLDNMGAYYGKEGLKSDSFYVVGNNQVSSSATKVINANKLSDVKNILKQLYGNEYKEDQVKEAVAVTYMKTGKLPKDLPDNYKIKELDKIKVAGGITFTVYEVNYDTTYDLSDKNSGKKSEKGKKQKVHTQEICAYSDTDDIVEIVLYQEVFDKAAALKDIKAFLGAK